MDGKKSPRPEPILGKLFLHPINTSEQGRDTTVPKDLASPREPKRGEGISMAADLQANSPPPQACMDSSLGVSFFYSSF